TGRPARFHRLKQRRRLSQHSLPAPERPVIHRLVAIGGPVPQIVNADLDQPSLFRPGHYPVIERPREKLRENREHMERHDRFRSFKPSGSSTSIRFAAMSIVTQIDRAKGIHKSPTSSKPDAPPSFQPVTVPRDWPVPRSITSHPIRSLW